MKYNKTTMTKLIDQKIELRQELKRLKAEMDLEKDFAVKALYHSFVANSGKYMEDYKALERP
jgi:hypothetical protein